MSATSPGEARHFRISLLSVFIVPSLFQRICLGCQHVYAVPQSCMELHGTLWLLRYNMVFLCRGFVATDLASARTRGVLDVDGEKERPNVTNTRMTKLYNPGKTFTAVRKLRGKQ